MLASSRKALVLSLSQMLGLERTKEPMGKHIRERPFWGGTSIFALFRVLNAIERKPSFWKRPKSSLLRNKDWYNSSNLPFVYMSAICLQ